MTLTVSVSELRNNLAQYLERVTNGANLLVRDQKKDVTIAQVTPIHTFDPVAFEKALRKAAGVFTAEKHPEWATKKKVIAWLRKTRLANERSFNNIPPKY